jgi:hypothetical protein
VVKIYYHSTAVQKQVSVAVDHAVWTVLLWTVFVLSSAACDVL